MRWRRRAVAELHQAHVSHATRSDNIIAPHTTRSTESGVSLSMKGRQGSLLNSVGVQKRLSLCGGVMDEGRIALDVSGGCIGWILVRENAMKSLVICCRGEGEAC